MLPSIHWCSPDFIEENLPKIADAIQEEELGIPEKDRKTSVELTRPLIRELKKYLNKYKVGFRDGEIEEILPTAGKHSAPNKGKGA